MPKTEYLQRDLDVEEFMANGYCEACLNPAKNWTEPNRYGHLELFVDEDMDGNLVGFLCPDCANKKKEVLK